MESKPPVNAADRPEEFRETLAERTHENWAAARLKQGWRHGAVRDDAKKEHPSLVPYGQLSEDEKDVDRAVSSGVLDAVSDLGYRVVPDGFDVFREYEFIAASTQFLTERRQSSSQTFLTINTAVFVVFGLLIKEAGLRDLLLALASLPLIIGGWAACFVWHTMLVHFRSLIRWRFEVLRELEGEEAMRHSRHLYTREWKDYLARQGSSAFRFSTLEGNLPFLFAILYTCYFAAVVWMALLA
jgi:ryanodine receptor 2